MSWNESVPILNFTGLRNKLDTVQQRNNNLKVAVNWDIDDDGWLHTRDDYIEVGDAEVLFVTDDKQAGFVINAGTLFIINNMTDELIPILENVGTGPYHFVNAGQNVFLMGSEKTFAIYTDRIVPWGIEIPMMSMLGRVANAGTLNEGTYRIAYAFQDAYGAVSGTQYINSIKIKQNDGIAIEGIPQKEGYTTLILVSCNEGSILYILGAAQGTNHFISSIESATQRFDYVNCFAPPLGGPIAYWNGMLWVAVHDAIQNFSELYSSIPNSMHHFRILDAADISELGECRMLIGTSVGLVIGTERQIILYRDYDTRIELAQYGVPKGNQWDYDVQRNAWFTTHRGVRVVGAGENLFRDPNDNKYLTQWGDTVGCGFIQRNGISQFISCELESHVGFRSPFQALIPQLLDHDIEEN